MNSCPLASTGQSVCVDTEFRQSILRGIGILQSIDLKEGNALLVVRQHDGEYQEVVSLSRCFVLQPNKNLAASESVEPWEPTCGTDVEVLLGFDECVPPHYKSGVVKDLKGNNFYSVQFDNALLPAIFERESLLKPQELTCLESLEIKEEVIKVDPKVRPWIISSDGLNCLEQVLHQSGLLVARVSDCDGGTNTTASLVLTGEEGSLVIARAMLRVHLKHQKQIQVYHELRERKLSQTTRLKDGGGGHLVEFKVDDTLVGPFVVGHAGKTLQQIQKDYQVEVRVLTLSDDETQEDTESSPSVAGYRLVQICGADSAKVQAARQLLEFAYEEYYLPEQSARWLYEGGNSRISEIAKSADLNSVWLDEEKLALTLVGTRSHINDAILFLDSMVEYLPVIAVEKREQQSIRQSFAQLESQYGTSARRKANNNPLPRQPSNSSSLTEEERGSGTSKKKTWVVREQPSRDQQNLDPHEFPSLDSVASRQIRQTPH